MSEEPQAGAQADWQQALDALERSLRHAMGAVDALRRGMMPRREPGAPALPEEDDRPDYAPEPVEEPEALEERGPAAAGPGRSSFERLWDRLEEERQGEAQAGAEPERKGLAALPTQYIFTIEDMEGRADLIALHRAFEGLRNVREISLMSFVNGVPIVSVNAERELDLAELAKAIGEATDRECDIVTQDGPKVHVRLRSRVEGAA